jgi:carotenoid cleavage dioxygenase-like enzyme
MSHRSDPLPVALSGQYVCVGGGMFHAVALGEGSVQLYRDCSIATDATDVIAFGGSILAFGAGALARELGAGLDTVRRVDLGGAGRSLTAHPKIDPVTGELHVVTFATDPAQMHVRVSPGGLTRTIRSIDNAPGRVHQLELTQDDVVLLADGFVGVAGRTGVDANATWFAVETEARRIASPHSDRESVTVYAAGPSLERWTLGRRMATAHCHVLDATPQTIVGTNRPPQAAANRFLWTVGSGAVHKHDLSAGTRRSHTFGRGRQPGPLEFIADPDRGTEDAGWLVGFVQDEAGTGTDFVVLDAQTIERAPVAVVRIPRRIPNGATGTWIPAAQI